MKNPIYLFIFLVANLIMISCQPQAAQTAETVDHTAKATEFINNWFTALNSSNWEEEVKAFLTEDDSFAEFHKPFREAFPDYHATVKEVISDGETIVAYIKVKASHQGDFPFGEFKGVEPSGKTAEWEEVLASRLIDGKFSPNPTFFLADNLGRMQQFGIDCLPKEKDSE